MNFNKSSNKVSFEGESEKSHQLSEILDETSSIKTSNDSKIHESGSIQPDVSPKKREPGQLTLKTQVTMGTNTAKRPRITTA